MNLLQIHNDYTHKTKQKWGREGKGHEKNIGQEYTFC